MKKGIKVLLIFILVIALAASGFWMVHRFIDSKEKQETFRELADSVLLEEPEPASTPKPFTFPFLEHILPIQQEEQSAMEDGPEVLHDIDALQAKNADCIGWIRVPGTDIDYPLMWTPNDPEHYLHTDFYGNYSDYGVPFLDYRCDQASSNLILYGHNMFDGSMFTDLLWYRDKEYMDNHSQIILETPEGAREYKVFAVCKANSMTSGVYKHTNFVDHEGLTEFLDSIKSEGVYYEDPFAAKYITLSTCDVSRRNGRIAVVGELVGREYAI